MTNIVSFDAEKATRYIEKAMLGFVGDPPDSEFQSGFLSCLLVIYEEGLGKGVSDERVKLLKGYLGITSC